MIILKPVKSTKNLQLIYNEKELLIYENKKHYLTPNGELNFLSTMATLYLVNPYSKNKEKTQKKFDEILKADTSVLGSIKKYMISFIKLKIEEGDPDIKELFREIEKQPYYLNLKVNTTIYSMIEKQIIEDISIYRNIDFGNHLISNISLSLLNFPNNKNISNSEIIKTISEDTFQKTMIRLIDELTLGNEKHTLEIKKLIYNCNFYSKSRDNNNMLALSFCLDIKKNANLFELNFKKIINNQKKIISSIYKTNILLKRKNRGNNRGPKL